MYRRHKLLDLMKHIIETVSLNSINRLVCVAENVFPVRSNLIIYILFGGGKSVFNRLISRRIFFWIISNSTNGQTYWSVSHFWLHIPQIPPLLIPSYALNHNFTECMRYWQWKFVFDSSQGCNARHSFHCRLVVHSITVTDNNDSSHPQRWLNCYTSSVLITKIIIVPCQYSSDSRLLGCDTI
jgi:hypothetical protein